MFLPFWVCAHFTLCWRERWPLFHYLKLGLGAVLAFVGAKMLLVHTAWRTDTLSALLVVATVIAASFLASLLCRRREHRNKVAVLSINATRKSRGGRNARTRKKLSTQNSRTLPFRLWWFARLCGFAWFWRRAACGCPAGKIFVGNCKDIVFSE